MVRHWFLAGLACVLVAGFSAPLALQSATRSIPRDLVVAVVLFLMTLPLDASTMWKALRHPRAVLLAIGLNLGLLPLLAWGVSPGLSEDMRLGLIIAACIPSTVASGAVLTRRAGGNDAVAILVTMATNLMCIVVTPLWLLAITGAAVESEGFQPARMAAKLGMLVAVPILAAQLLRLARPIGRWASRRKTPLGVLAQTGLLTMVFIGAVGAGLKLAGNTEPVSTLSWLAMLAAVIGLHLVALWCGHWLGRLCGIDRKDRIAVGFSGSQKTLMVGLHIALSPPFNSGLAMLPMVAYHVCQLLLDTVIANRMRKS